MQVPRPGAPFEVHCPRCRVTFPVGTRRCIHCGGRTSAERNERGARLGLPPAEEDPGAALEEPGDEVTRPRGFSPLTLVWIALLVGGYAMRACSGH